MVDTSSPLWQKVVKKGKRVEGSPVANTLTKSQIGQILSEFKGERDQKQLFWDLTVPKYRLFDEIGMMLTGRVDDEEKAKKIAGVFSWCLDKKEVKDRETLYDCFFKRLEVSHIPPISFKKMEEVI